MWIRHGCCLTVLCLCTQVGSLIIFLEYERTRRKEVLKQQKEAAERQGIIERARLEREVSHGSWAAATCQKCSALFVLLHLPDGMCLGYAWPRSQASSRRVPGRWDARCEWCCMQAASASCSPC
jgi:hypothetical protein